MDLEKNVMALLEMAGSGQMLEAFEKFYAENIVMQENSEEPRVGKKLNREFEQEFMDSIEEVHYSGVKNIAFNHETNVAMIQYSMDASFKGIGRMQMEEVAVQQWKDGKIIHERFFYNRG